jgi:spermidine/putrescine transport system permease protein
MSRASHSLRKFLTPYVLLAPGLLWLVVFFVLPTIQMFLYSVSKGSVDYGYHIAWSLDAFAKIPRDFPRQFGNSLMYGTLATVLTFLISFPLAYFIAFRGGRYKNLILFLVIAPFFTSFLIRTISWEIILGNNGPVIGLMHAVDIFRVVPENFTFMGEPVAVVSGLVYNFLPFMTLPLYVALERIDPRLIEAAQDLYAGPWRPRGWIYGGIGGGLLGGLVGFGIGWAVVPFVAVGAAVGAVGGAYFVSESFLRITLPLSLPGVFAGSLLTFIPALGDYVNATLLGSPKTQMIGNVIQARFLESNDYPTASALSFVLMVGIIIAVMVYARLLGTEDLSGGVTI